MLYISPSLLILFSGATGNFIVRAAGKELASWKNSFYLGQVICRPNFKIKIWIPSSFILILCLRKLAKKDKYCFSKPNFKGKKEEGSYMFVFCTNKYTLMVLVFTWFGLVSLNKTLLLSSSVFLSESALNWGRTNIRWGWLEKEVETRFNTQFIKSKLEDFKKKKKKKLKTTKQPSRSCCVYVSNHSSICNLW